MTILPHALQRYLSRSGTSEKHSVRAMEFLFRAAEGGVRLSGNRRYYQGWIVVVRKEEIRTAYKPHKAEEHRAIYEAHQRLLVAKETSNSKIQTSEKIQ